MTKLLPLLLILCLYSACGGDDDNGPVPVAVIIESLQVDRFPAEASDSTSWDQPTFGRFPDIIFAIENNGTNTEVYSHPNDQRFEDVAANTVLEWTNLNIRLENPGTVDYAISIFDYDEDGDLRELMGGVVARFYNSATGTPDMAILDANGEVAYSVGLSYEF